MEGGGVERRGTELTRYQLFAATKLHDLVSDDPYMFAYIFKAIHHQ